MAKEIREAINQVEDEEDRIFWNLFYFGEGDI